MTPSTLLFAIGVFEYCTTVLQGLSGRPMRSAALFSLAFLAAVLSPPTLGVFAVAMITTYAASLVPRTIDAAFWSPLSPLRLLRRWPWGRAVELRGRRALGRDRPDAEGRSTWLITSMIGLGLSSQHLVAAALSFAVLLPSIRRAWIGHESHVPAVRALFAIAASGLISIGLSAVAFQAHWVSVREAEVLQQLVAVQLVFGAVPLTILALVAQVSVSTYGPRAYTTLPFGRFLIGIVAVGTSISLDLYFLGTRTVEPGLAELLEILVFAVAIAAGASAVSAIWALDEARIARALVTRLDRDWLDFVERQHENPYQPVPADFVDHFAAIERMLYIAVTRDSDIRRTRRILALLLERFDDLGAQRAMPRRFGAPPAIEAELAAHDDARRLELEGAIDAYVARRLAPLVVDVARERKAWALESVVEFRREMSGTALCRRPAEAANAAAALGRSRLGEPPLTMKVYDVVIREAIEHGLDEVVSKALLAANHAADRALTDLPDPTGMWDIDPNAPVEYRHDHPAQVAADGLEGYLEWMVAVGNLAQKKKRPEVLEAIASQLRFFKGSVRKVADARWVRWLLGQVGLPTWQIARAGRSLGVLAYWPPFGFDTPNPADSRDQAYTQHEAYWMPAVLVSTVDFINQYVVTQAGLLAYHMLPSFVDEAASIAAALEVIRTHIDSLSAKSPDQRVVRKELDSRLQQIRSRPHDSPSFESRVSEMKPRWQRELEASQ